MSSFLNQHKITLQARLSLHVGFSVAIKAKDFTSESGILQKVGKQFMKVDNQFFVPLTLEQITLLGFSPNLTGEAVHIRSTLRGTFSARLVRTGFDFIELFIPTSQREWILIPLNKVISIEKG